MEFRFFSSIDLVYIFCDAYLLLSTAASNKLERGIVGQYFEVFFSAESHSSCKMRLLSYNYKNENSKVPSENEDIINFVNPLPTKRGVHSDPLSDFFLVALKRRKITQKS